MESLSSFITVREANKQNRFSQQTIKAMVIFELWRLHNLGYLHGDAHGGNFMIDPNYRYFNGTPGRVVVIDFGSVYRHAFGLLDKTQMVTVSDRSQINKDGHPTPSGWMKISSKRIAHYNTLLLQMHADRETEKQLFLRHVLESVAPKEEKEEEEQQQQLIIGGGPMLEINDFDLLDPSHIFTPTFISSYVEQEQHNSEQVNDLASGWTKQRIKNKTKTKSRKR
jgi:serine/threonine protein kinase